MGRLAQSLHVLSDVITLVVALVNISICPREWSESTYGWARAEVVGALINSVFLPALCFSVTVEAVKRFLAHALKLIQLIPEEGFEFC